MSRAILVSAVFQFLVRIEQVERIFRKYDLTDNYSIGYPDHVFRVTVTLKVLNRVKGKEMKLRSEVEQKRIAAEALNSELKARLIKIFEAASENSEILMRHQNGCMVIEDRAPGDFTSYLTLMKSNTLYLTDMNSYMKLSFVDSRTGHNWAFLLHRDSFAAIESEMAGPVLEAA